MFFFSSISHKSITFLIVSNYSPHFQFPLSLPPFPSLNHSLILLILFNSSHQYLIHCRTFLLTHSRTQPSFSTFYSLSPLNPYHPHSTSHPFICHYNNSMPYICMVYSTLILCINVITTQSSIHLLPMDEIDSSFNI